MLAPISQQGGDLVGCLMTRPHNALWDVSSYSPHLWFATLLCSATLFRSAALLRSATPLCPAALPYSIQVSQPQLALATEHDDPVPSLPPTFSSTLTPFIHSRRPVSPALYLYPLNDSFVPKHITLLPQQRVKIGRQTNAKAVPGECNGHFDSKVLNSQQAEVWEQDGKVFSNLPLLSPSLHEDNFAPQIYTKDVKSSNGMFIDGERLSGEGLESEPFELKSKDVVVSRFHPFATSCTANTGGKGALTQQAHGEFIVSSETICLPNTQWVHGEYF